MAVVHTGDEMGFVEGLLTSESKSMKDHHEEMDGRRFEGWSAKVLPCLMENALYHAVIVDMISNQIWKETDIQELLQSHNVSYEDNSHTLY
jgi:hypothetical protein